MPKVNAKLVAARKNARYSARAEANIKKIDEIIGSIQDQGLPPHQQRQLEALLMGSKRDLKLKSTTERLTIIVKKARNNPKELLKTLNRITGAEIGRRRRKDDDIDKKIKLIGLGTLKDRLKIITRSEFYLSYENEIRTAPKATIERLWRKFNAEKDEIFKKQEEAFIKSIKK